MATSEEYSHHMQEARHLLMEGEAREAFQTFRLVLRYPRHPWRLVSPFRLFPEGAAA